MAFSKARDFAPDHYSQAFWFNVLSHPARLVILEHLLENGDSIFSDIRKKIPLAKTTVSGHFRWLTKAELISGVNHHPDTLYALRPDRCAELIRYLRLFEKSFLENPFASSLLHNQSEHI